MCGSQRYFFKIFCSPQETEFDQHPPAPPIGGKGFATPAGFFWILKRKFLKSEARHLAIGGNFDSNFHDFVSFTTLVWA